MDAKTIVKIAARYRTELYSYGVKPVCMNPDLSFDQLSPSTLLNHALFLVESIMQKSKKHIGKMNRHLAFVQSILFVTGLYTIKELKENKRRSRKHRLIPYN